MKGFYWLCRRIEIFKNLRGAQERKLFLQALFLALFMPLLLRLRLTTLMRYFEPQTLAEPPGSSAERQGQVVLWALEFARPLVRSGCLVRGLTLYGSLRRVGWNISLCFGVAPWKQGFTGHCWLTREGRPFLEPEGEGPGFSPVLQFPRKGVGLAE